MTTSSRTFLVWLAVSNLVLMAIGTIGASVGFPWLGLTNHMAFLSFSVSAVGILTFFGLLWSFSATNSGVLGEQSLRTSITVAVITVYLIIVGEVAFFTAKTDLAKITDVMLTSFTSIVGVVVAFFFATSAYVEVKKREKDTK